MISDPNPNKRYSCRGFSGVAVRFAGYPKTYIQNEWYETNPETGEEEYYVDGEVEVDDDVDSGNVYVIMVGDDYKHLVRLADLTEIDEEDYCACCGQIDCRWR